MEFTAVASSNINGIAYKEASQELFVEFKGGSRYRYDGVDQDTYDDFMSSPSKGSFFAENIKDAYPTTRV